jgi:hypothetical protein
MVGKRFLVVGKQFHCQWSRLGITSAGKLASCAICGRRISAPASQNSLGLEVVPVGGSGQLLWLPVAKLQECEVSGGKWEIIGIVPASLSCR